MRAALLLALWGCGKAPAPGAEPCTTDAEQYAADVAPVVETDCLGCHVSEGAAADTRQLLVAGEDEANRMVLHTMATEVVGERSLLLAKATGELEHGGGARVAEGDADWLALEEFVARAFSEGGCEHPGAPSLDCATTGLQPGTSPLRRLTDRQALAAAADLLDVSVASGVFPVTAADGGMSTWPTANTVSAAGAEGIMEFAEAAAAGADVSACASDEEAVAWSLAFAEAAFRRPLEDDSAVLVEAMVELGDDPEDGCRAVIELALQSPRFLYLDTTTESVDDDGVASLDGYAVASRLSFFLWNTTPDADLLAEAESGTLSTRAGVRETARRMVDDPRAVDMVVRFHHDWLRLERLDEVSKDDELYPSWNGSTLDQARQETELFVSEVVWLGDGRFDALLDSQETWLTPELAEIYGVSVEDDTPEWSRVELDGSRPGVLTRAAWLAAHGYANTSAPVRRGAFLLEQLYCEDLAPPADVDFDLPEAVEGESVRDRLQQHREDPSCAVCHERIDPAGFAFEHYGPVGEWREVWEDGLTVDASGELDGTSFDDAAGLLQNLDRSRARACYAERWFEYAIGRPAENADACGLERLETRFEASEGDLRELVVAISQSDAFLHVVPE